MEKEKLVKKPNKAEMVKNVLALLAGKYPDAKAELDFSSPFELLVATILSAQCTDKQVNKATAVLYEEYNTPEQFAVMAETQLEPYIHSCGFFRTKGKNIIATSKLIVSEHGGQVPMNLDALIALPGVGRKTANVVLSNAFGIPAIAVDTHVFRVANRIGLANAKDVLQTEQQLMKAIPKGQWSISHHLLIFHGRRCCSARKPNCENCVIAEYCKYHATQTKTKNRGK